ncbi:hypothetical protein N431DRAFT_95409 [Stipitochalara longipes BDJ]|nr:hypothetical protein N431DRAFT_95409 [Stipitochalara longipes BDJ]
MPSAHSPPCQPSTHPPYLTHRGSARGPRGKLPQAPPPCLPAILPSTDCGVFRHNITSPMHLHLPALLSQSRWVDTSYSRKKNLETRGGGGGLGGKIGKGGLGEFGGCMAPRFEIW